MSEGAEGLEKIIALEGRVEGIEKRMDKVDNNLQRVWERMDSHREGQIRTQTMVEVVDKNVSEIKLQMTKLNETLADSKQKNNDERVNSANKWEAFFAKAFWVAIGAVVTLAVYVITHFK